MAEYKPTAFDKLISVMPSLISTYASFKLGQDRLAADKERIDLQKGQFARTQALAEEKAQADLDFREQTLDMAARRDYMAGKRWEDEMILKEMEKASADKARVATQQYQADMLAEAIRKSKVAEEQKKGLLSLEEKKLAKITTQIDRDEAKESRIKTQAAQIPLLDYGIYDQDIMEQGTDPFFSDEGAIIDAWRNPEFQKQIGIDVNRLQHVKKGEKGYRNKIELLNKLKEYKKIMDSDVFYDSNIFTGERIPESPMFNPFVKSDEFVASRSASQNLDVLIALLDAK